MYFYRLLISAPVCNGGIGSMLYVENLISTKVHRKNLTNREPTTQENEQIYSFRILRLVLLLAKIMVGAEFYLYLSLWMQRKGLHVTS